MSAAPSNEAPCRLLDGVDFGADVIVGPFTNLYGCRIGDQTRIGPFVELEDEVCVGHGAMFINDKFPAATTDQGALKTDEDWELARTIVERRAALGSGVVVLGGVRIGAGALVGAGAVVTRDVAPDAVVSGVPARVHERP